MISLYRVIGTVEAYVLAGREEDANERMESISLGGSRGAVSFAPTETIKVTEDDCIREAESLRKEATRIEEHAARLRAQIAMLEALAQPKAPVATRTEPRPSINEATSSLRTYFAAQFPRGYARHDGETIHYYPGDERGPSVSRYLGYPVVVKTGGAREHGLPVEVLVCPEALGPRGGR